MPLAATIHDLSFVAHPEWFPPRERWRRRFLTARTAAAAAVVLTDSEFSRGELERRLRVPAERIRVIAPGVAPPGPRRESGPAAGEPIVLYTGSLFNRRRLPDLIAAFALATSETPEARLVIVGADRTWPAQDLPAVAAAHGVAARVDLRRYVPDAELDSLYARAAVFVFLSEYEGFGLTPLEALRAGVPIVVLDTPVAREVYGAAAVYVRSGDIAGTAAAIRRILRDPASAAPQLAAAPAVLGRCSWERAADQTLAALEGTAR